jgi:hypothetical protein
VSRGKVAGVRKERKRDMVRKCSRRYLKEFGLLNSSKMEVLVRFEQMELHNVIFLWEIILVSAWRKA